MPHGRSGVSAARGGPGEARRALEAFDDDAAVFGGEGGGEIVEPGSAALFGGEGAGRQSRLDDFAVAVRNHRSRRPPRAIRSLLYRAFEPRHGAPSTFRATLEHFSFRLNRNESSKPLYRHVSEPQKWYPLLLETF